MNHRRGLTLLELAAVVLLLGLAFGVLASGLSQTTDAAALRESEAQVANADLLARRAALNGGVVMFLESEGTVLCTIDSAGHELASITLARGCSVSFETASASSQLTSLTFDLRGRTTDYRVRLRGAGASRVWTTSGITGWRTEEPAP